MSPTLVNLAGLATLGLLTLVFAWLLWGRDPDLERRSALPLKILLTALTLLITFGIGNFNLGPRASASDPLSVVVACFLCGINLCVAWTTELSALLASPLASLFDGAGREAAAGPLYSIAEAQRKRGRFDEAIAEIHRQLERHPGDVQGTLMIASIQAENLHDVPAACATLENWLQHHRGASAGAPLVLHQLAEIQLIHHRDPIAARQTLERLVSLAPGSDAAHLAQQRIAHLTSRDMLLERQHAAVIPIGHYEDRLGLRVGPPPDLVSRPDPEVEARRLRGHLAQYPEDQQTRETLALHYAQELSQFDLAVQELEILVGNPHATEAQISRWLNLLCDLQLRSETGAESARLTLQRIIETFPGSPGAAAARHRIPLLALQAGANKKSQALRLGSADPCTGKPGL